jgi:hypothetical protein
MTTENFGILRKYIQDTFTAIKTINTKHTSYGLKHVAERALNFYISNDEFIEAMILEGFNAHYKCSKENSHFNISNKFLLKQTDQTV